MSCSSTLFGIGNNTYTCIHEYDQFALDVENSKFIYKSFMIFYFTGNFSQT